MRERNLREGIMAEKNPVVLMTTSVGNIRIELDAEKAPISTKNFVDYVSAGHYDGLLFHRGTIAMARTNVVDSATSQFFINVKDNDFLNHRSTAAAEFGYAVFGRVIEGMDVVQKIEKVKTGNK